MTDRQKTPPYFDEEEQALVEAIERGEFQPSEGAAERIAILKQAAINSVKARNGLAETMKEEYDLSKMKSRKNPYAARLKR